MPACELVDRMQVRICSLGAVHLSLSHAARPSARRFPGFRPAFSAYGSRLGSSLQGSSQSADSAVNLQRSCWLGDLICTPGPLPALPSVTLWGETVVDRFTPGQLDLLSSPELRAW